MQRVPELVDATRTHHACDLAAVVHQHERRPQLDAERATEPPTLPVLDQDVPDLWILDEHLIDQRPRRPTESAPVSAELDQRGAG